MIFPTNSLKSALLRAALILFVLTAGVFYTCSTAHAGGSACGHLTHGTNNWQVCQIEWASETASTNWSRINDLETELEIAGDIRIDLELRLQAEIEERQRALFAAKRRIEQLESEAQAWRTMHIELTETRQDSLIESIIDQVETNRVATLDQSLDIWDLEVDVNGINGTDFGGLTTQVSLLAEHVTGEAGYVLSYGAPPLLARRRARNQHVRLVRRGQPLLPWSGEPAGRDRPAYW